MSGREGENLFFTLTDSLTLWYNTDCNITFVRQQFSPLPDKDGVEISDICLILLFVLADAVFHFDFRADMIELGRSRRDDFTLKWRSKGFRSFSLETWGWSNTISRYPLTNIAYHQGRIILWTAMTVEKNLRLSHQANISSRFAIKYEFLLWPT